MKITAATHSGMTWKDFQLGKRAWGLLSPCFAPSRLPTTADGRETRSACEECWDPRSRPSPPGHAPPCQWGKGLFKSQHFPPFLRRKWGRARKKKRKRGVKVLKTGGTEKSKGWKGEEQDRVWESGQHSARAALHGLHSTDAVCWWWWHLSAWSASASTRGFCRPAWSRVATGMTSPTTCPGRFPLRVPTARQDGPCGRQEPGRGWVSLPPARVRRWAGWEKSHVRGLLGLEITLSSFHFLIDTGCPAQKRNLERPLPALLEMQGAIMPGHMMQGQGGCWAGYAQSGHSPGEHVGPAALSLSSEGEGKCREDVCKCRGGV